MKARLVYHVKEYMRVIGYDNFEGKGDHRHYKGKEYTYIFESLEKLWNDFKADIKLFKEDVR